jgi:TolB-like protein
MSADADQEYFSDGITEEIINALVRVPGIKVAARTSVFAFKGQEKDIRAIGDELDVTHVVEGSVRSDGQQLRITAQLIQVKDGFHLWSETFDRERVNVFAIQEEIAGAIAAVLNEQLGVKNPVSEAPRISVQAYDDYLRGRAHLRARSDPDLKQALQLFQSVTEAYPDYAPGWAALAITADVMDDQEAAEVAAQRALAIDPNNVDALNALGAVYRDAWRWQEAENLFNRALAIDPDSAELLEDIAEFMAGTGRVEEQLEVAERGYAIDPYLDPLVGVYAEALITAGQTEKGIGVLDRATARGGAEWLRATKLMAYMPVGDVDAMRRLIEQLDYLEDNRAIALAALDDPGSRQKMQALVNSMPRPEEIDDAAFVKDSVALLALLYLGEVEPVLDAFQQRFALKGWGSTEYWFMPHMAAFRAHPRFAELLNQVGLPAYWDQAGWPEFCARAEEGMIQCH